MILGNIASGKSTECAGYVQHGYALVSGDEKRYEWGGGEYVFDAARESELLDSLYQDTCSLMDVGRNIVVDETWISITRARRHPYIALARERGYKIICVVMPRRSMEAAVAARLKNEHGTFGRERWESVWKMFDEMYEEPVVEEGFSSIVYSRVAWKGG